MFVCVRICGRFDNEIITYGWLPGMQMDCAPLMEYLVSPHMKRNVQYSEVLQNVNIDIVFFESLNVILKYICTCTRSARKSA